MALRARRHTSVALDAAKHSGPRQHRCRSQQRCRAGFGQRHTSLVLRNRFLPQKEQQWKVTSRPKTKRFIENYLLKRFGDTLLGDLDKFTLQTYLNEMAPRYSKSVLSKIRVYFNSMLDEAVELETLPKNPAGKLAVPKSGKRRATKHLTPEEIPQILFHLSDRDRLIVRMFLVLGLRPGEMFALRWNDKQGNSLRIDSSIIDGMEVETKTQDSEVLRLASGFDRHGTRILARHNNQREPERVHFPLKPRHRNQHE